MSTDQPSVFRTVAKSRVSNPEIVKRRTESFADSAAKWTGQPHAQLYLPASLSPDPFHITYQNRHLGRCEGSRKEQYRFGFGLPWCTKSKKSHPLGGALCYFVPVSDSNPYKCPILGMRRPPADRTGGNHTICPQGKSAIESVTAPLAQCHFGAPPPILHPAGNLRKGNDD